LVRHDTGRPRGGPAFLQHHERLSNCPLRLKPSAPKPGTKYKKRKVT
jgi:hypothetical protein